MALEPASHVKLVTKQTFGRTLPGAARETAPEALPNGALLGTYQLVVWSSPVPMRFPFLHIFDRDHTVWRVILWGGG